MAYIRQDVTFAQRFEQYGSVRPWINTITDVRNRIISLVRAEVANNSQSSVHFCIYFGEYKAWIECFGSQAAAEFPGVFPVSEAKRTEESANTSKATTSTFSTKGILAA